jgi:hypothetical protein
VKFRGKPEKLANAGGESNNECMSVTAKKPRPRQRKPSRLKAVGKPKAAARPSLAEDAAERTKIGKTLDGAAFSAFHKRNSASAKYWETPE